MFRILRRLKLIYIWFKIIMLESSESRLRDRERYLLDLRFSAWVGIQKNRNKPLGLVFQANHRDIDNKVNENRDKLQKITGECEFWQQQRDVVETKLK